MDYLTATKTYANSLIELTCPLKQIRKIKYFNY